MAFPKIDISLFSQAISALLKKELQLGDVPEVRVNTSAGFLGIQTDNMALYKNFTMFRELLAIGRGYLTDPESNVKGTVASLEILLNGTLHDGHETACRFAVMDLLPNGEIAFIRFGDEGLPALKAA